jgi:hypothetical protein
MKHADRLHQILVKEYNNNPGTYSTLWQTARMASLHSDHYPAMKAFVKNEPFSPQKLIRECSAAESTLHMPQSKETMRKLLAFAWWLEAELQAAQTETPE